MRSIVSVRSLRFGLALTGIIALLGVFAPSPARAYEDRVSLDLAAKAFVSPDLRAGPQIGGSLGLTDTWTVRSGVGYALSLQTPISHGARAHVDLLYLVDIVEWVPFFGLRAGAELLFYPEVSVVPFGGIVAGLDHFMSRDLIIGLDVAWTPEVRPDEVAQAVSLALRLSVLFDT